MSDVVSFMSEDSGLQKWLIDNPSASWSSASNSEAEVTSMEFLENSLFGDYNNSVRPQVISTALPAMNDILIGIVTEDEGSTQILTSPTSGSSLNIATARLTVRPLMSNFTHAVATKGFKPRLYHVRILENEEDIIASRYQSIITQLLKHHTTGKR
ncbi:unnamed protein product [Gordionus sp. m RMFG-2023]